MKKVLVINYSNSGQLNDIITNLTQELKADIDRVNFYPKDKFPFPWNRKVFFDQMPESVLEIPREIDPIDFKYDHYDLVILGHQPWYLSPSIPTNSLFHYQPFLDRIRNAPVITVIGARNLWLSAQESVKEKLKSAGANLVANLPFVDKSNNALGVISIAYWLLTGKKKRPLGIFPKPGVAEEDIKNAELYTPLIQEALDENNYATLQDQCLGLKMIQVDAAFAFAEPKAKKVFRLWAKTIVKKKNRRRWVKLFVYYLLFVIYIVVPIELTLYYLLIYPFTIKRINQKKAYFCSVNFAE